MGFFPLPGVAPFFPLCARKGRLTHYKAPCVSRKGFSLAAFLAAPTESSPFFSTAYLDLWNRGKPWGSRGIAPLWCPTGLGTRFTRNFTAPWLGTGTHLGPSYEDSKAALSNLSGRRQIVPIAKRARFPTFESNIRGKMDGASKTGRRVPNRGAHRRRLQRTRPYGEQTRLPYTEEMPLRGCYPYDVSKSAADLLAQSYAHTYGLRSPSQNADNLISEW